MTSKLAELIEAGKALHADEREIAALALQPVDQAEQAEIDAAWDETIDRRLDELTNGTVAPVGGRETRAMGRALLAQRRRRRSTGTSTPKLVRSTSTPWPGTRASTTTAGSATSSPMKPTPTTGRTPRTSTARP